MPALYKQYRHTSNCASSNLCVWPIFDKHVRTLGFIGHIILRLQVKSLNISHIYFFTLYLDTGWFPNFLLCVNLQDLSAGCVYLCQRCRGETAQVGYMPCTPLRAGGFTLCLHKNRQIYRLGSDTTGPYTWPGLH